MPHETVSRCILLILVGATALCTTRLLIDCLDSIYIVQAGIEERYRIQEARFKEQERRLQQIYMQNLAIKSSADHLKFLGELEIGRDDFNEKMNTAKQNQILDDLATIKRRER